MTTVPITPLDFPNHPRISILASQGANSKRKVSVIISKAALLPL